MITYSKEKEVPETLAKYLVLDHINRNHPEFVASEDPAEPSDAPKPSTAG